MYSASAGIFPTMDRTVNAASAPVSMSLTKNIMRSMGHLKKCAAETKKRPVERSLQIAPVSSKRKIHGTAKNICLF